MSRFVRYGNSHSLDLGHRTLSAGLSPGETVGAGPLVPSERAYKDGSERYQNRLYLLENMMFGDAAGNKGADNDSTTVWTVSSGGQVLKTESAPSLSVDVPATQQTYQVEQTTTRKVACSQLSTKIRSEWAFVSAGPAYTYTYTRLALMDLAMAASGLDQHNRAGSAVCPSRSP